MSSYLNQHLVNPENCLRCNSCERVCAAGAISHDVNVVIDPDKCTACLECVAECPTGAVDHWRIVPREQPYTQTQQHGWQVLPQPLGIPAALLDPALTAPRSPGEQSSKAPSSAPVPSLNLYQPDKPVAARLRLNRRVSDPASASDIHHIVLEFDSQPMPVLEGQTIGILPPGNDKAGRPHMMRLYSVASARDGETPGKGDVALTVKRVVKDSDGQQVPGIASNYLCDLPVGAVLQVTGPYGASFLMPDDPAAKLLMIATGTGIAPMRAMIEQRRRRGDLASGNAMLFYGGRSRADMAYLPELESLGPDRLDLHLALSRTEGQPRRHVQNALIEQRDRVMAVLTDPQGHLYLCGQRTMERDVMAYLQRICMAARVDWTVLRAELHRSGRLHLESY